MFTDLTYLKKTFTLAKKGFGKTSPNPCVGAILVKNGKIIGQGYHQKAGENHAEINALNSCRENPAGAALYVSLEPCSHFGKTPPCTDAIIKAKIAQVIIPMVDPNPLVQGQGIKKLQASGIKVKIIESLQKKAESFNLPYLKYIKTDLPFVSLKVAMSLDGKIATEKGESKWITGLDSRKYGHKLRSQHDAILTGINTVLKDNPQLNVRHTKGKNPLKIVLDSKLRIPLKSKILRDKNILIVTTFKCDKTKLEKLRLAKYKIKIMNKKIDLKKLLRYLGQEKIQSVLIEAGGKLNFEFVKNGLVDKIYAFIAPKIIGGERSINAFAGEGIKILSKAIPIQKWQIKKIKTDLLIEANLHQL